MLRRWGTGDRQVESALFSHLHRELRKRAAYYLRGERAGHTLQPTELVHEAFLRLQDAGPVDWQDRAHFMALASRVMRRILVDHARARNALRRTPIQDDGNENAGPFSDRAAAEVLAVHEILDKLAVLKPRQAQVVEMHYFGGLSFEEIGAILGVDTRTAKRDWTRARLLLHKWISTKAS